MKTANYDTVYNNNIKVTTQVYLYRFYSLVWGFIGHFVDFISRFAEFIGLGYL
ncbi:hypothetical protein EMIT079MI2_270046 [Bacillus sp. IT-79MI2]